MNFSNAQYNNNNNDDRYQSIKSYRCICMQLYFSSHTYCRPFRCTVRRDSYTAHYLCLEMTLPRLTLPVLPFIILFRIRITKSLLCVRSSCLILRKDEFLYIHFTDNVLFHVLYLHVVFIIRLQQHHHISSVYNITVGLSSCCYFYAFTMKLLTT